MYELFDPRHVQCWHVTALPVSLHFSGCGIAHVAKQFWQWVVCCKWQLHGHTTFCDGHKMIVLILDICRIGTLLHLLCHCTSYVFGLILWWNNFDSGWLIATDNCNAIPSVVVPTILIEWWKLASSICYCHATLWDIPTNQLFDPWQLKCWHATSSTVSCIFYCRWIAAVVKQFWRRLARCKWLHCFCFCDCPTW